LKFKIHKIPTLYCGHFPLQMISQIISCSELNISPYILLCTDTVHVE